MLYDFPSTPVILLFVSRFYLHERISAVRLPSEKCPLNAVAVPWFPYLFPRLSCFVRTSRLPLFLKYLGTPISQKTVFYLSHGFFVSGWITFLRLFIIHKKYS